MGIQTEQVILITVLAIALIAVGFFYLSDENASEHAVNMNREGYAFTLASN
jgi:hypothetical protein